MMKDTPSRKKLLDISPSPSRSDSRDSRGCVRSCSAQPAMPSSRAVLDALGHPWVVQLERNLFAAVFVLLKLRMARHVVREAELRGFLRPGGKVIESTSGTMGLALAYACRESGHPLTIVGDPAIDHALQLKLQALGAKVIIVKRGQRPGGIQLARLNKLRQMMAASPGMYWTRQYDNPAVPDGFRPAAQAILSQVPSVAVLVASVGTGGSATGLCRGLQSARPSLKLVAVDTHHSVLFGQPDAKKLLRGLGNSILSKNLDYSLVDECHWVSASEAFFKTRELFQQYLLDIGPTSGATFMVAEWEARRTDKPVVFVCADTGERYRHTVYNPTWLESQGVLLTQVPKEPKQVNDPLEVTNSWCYMRWAGRPISSSQLWGY